MLSILIVTLLLVVHASAGVEDSLQCNGTGELMFEGDGQFIIVRDGESSNLICNGGVSVAVNSPLYTRITSDGEFSCNSSGSVRLCGYGEIRLVELATERLII